VLGSQISGAIFLTQCGDAGCHLAVFKDGPAAQGAAVDRTELSARRKIYLRAVVRSAGLESMAALAKELGITQSTLTNIQSAKRSASRELISKIEGLAPKIEDGEILGAEAFLRGQSVDLEEHHSIAERLKEANRERLQELQSSEERTSKNIGEVAKNFDSLGSDDVFIFISATRQPFEMDPDETILKPAILNAIRRNSFFIYLRPTREYLKSLDYFVDIESEFENFKATLFSGLSKEEKDEHTNHLVLIQAEHVSMFDFPDFKWDIFYSDGIDAPQMARAGIAVAAGDPSSSGADVRIPLSAASTKGVLFQAARAIWKVNSGRRGRGKVPNKVVDRLVKSAEQATKQKAKSGR
jgi:transcriptional regulator with XRE-family HTH domain